MEAITKHVAGTPLEEWLPRFAHPFVERRATELGGLDLSDPVLRGLARVLASNGEVARYLALRPEVLRRLAGADGSALERRTRELPDSAPRLGAGDLEGFLDAVRLFRRDETAYAACLDLGGLLPFEETSRFLSRTAEVVLERVLEAAESRTQYGLERGISVVAMGKLAGREMTYSSDLDLIFLYEGDTDATEPAARIAQRLIPYLSTPTGAGFAYAVDARLRPSGGQGLLVTSFDAYERYQQEQSRTWEHLALMRSRAVAGDLEHAGPLVQRVQSAICERRALPWDAVRDLRGRIASERARDGDGQVAFKTGAGGLIDVGFLAAGGRLERGEPGVTDLPSVPTMLSSATPGSEELLEGYRFLRLLEARARWVAGRAVDALPSEPEPLQVVAELVEPGLESAALLERTERALGKIRTACERVLDAGTIDALGA